MLLRRLFRHRINMYTTTLLLYISSASVLPALWPYLEAVRMITSLTRKLGADDTYFGVAMSCFSLGQIIGSPTIGKNDGHR